MSDWISVEERLPESGQKVLAFYKNELGNGRRVCAEYIRQYEREDDGDNDYMESEYHEERDTYYWPAGWYESIENWGDFGFVTIHPKVTQWHLLPEPPKEES